MSTGTTLTFHLPEGWTLRKVANAMVREWLPPFRAEPAARAPRWVVQSVVEDNSKAKAPLWEPGISTAEYEERLDRADLCWAVRASSGRGKGTILARFALSKEEPQSFQVVCCQSAFPEALFDAAKVDEYLKGEAPGGVEELFTALLASNGFEIANIG
jgi:hypothetical protein